MNWKLKAKIQNLVACLPARVSRPAHYFLQRKFGRLRRPDPRKRLAAGVAILDRIAELGRTARSAHFLEVGTGRRLNLPIVLWLAGAGRITTVDLNCYLKAALVLDDLRWMRNHPAELKACFGRHAETPGFAKRWERLADAKAGTKADLAGLLEMMNVCYRAPADAARLDLPSGSIDYHVSFTVFEHVPAGALENVLREGKRILKRTGRLLHFVDFGDHFAHGDPSISSINFLRFDEARWRRYAGNPYTYHNRLRVDDFANLFRRAGLEVSLEDCQLDPRALEELRNGFPLDQRFAGKSDRANAALNAWLVASPAPSGLPPHIVKHARRSALESR